MVEEPSKFIDEPEDDIDMIREVTYKELPSKVASELFVDEYNSSRLSTVFHSSYSENTTADVLLYKIGDAFSKSKISSEDEDEKGCNRTLCILDKVVRIMELQHGELLVSIGLDTYCERKKTIRMQILNEPAERSFTDAPENIDYPVDAETFFDKKLLRWGLTGECVFSVENKERAKEPYILCQTCKGSGTIKCASCQGTDREQYVDGYFANGEERIKTGVCSDCQGSGRVTCPECEGDGKIEVFAPIYAVSKSVEEEISQVAFCAYATPWNHYAESCYYSCSDPENDNDDREEPGLLLSQNIQEHLNRDGFFRISMKNRKEKLIDRADRVARAMKELNVSELYKQNENTIREWLKCYRRKNLICRKEQHYLLPISRLTVKISDENPKDIYVIPYDKNSTIAVMENSAYIGETGILKYLFYKLFK